MAVRGKIRVLIVDDSAVARHALAAILEEDPDITIMGTAADPFSAARRIQEEVPDVIMLDVEMPRMDGITFLKKLMAQCPLPVVMCSSVTEKGSDAMLQAHYPLQALLYEVALHRFLRWRVAGYDPARHLGGVLYLFLRGMCGPEVSFADGSVPGVFAWLPPATLVVAASDVLAGGAS